MNSSKLRRVRQQVSISCCGPKTVYPQTASIPISWLGLKASTGAFNSTPHSFKGSGNLWRLEIERTLFV